MCKAPALCMQQQLLFTTVTNTWGRRTVILYCCPPRAEIDSIHQLVVGATENIKEGNEDIRGGYSRPRWLRRALSLTPGGTVRDPHTQRGHGTMQWMDQFHSFILPSPGPAHCPAEERSRVQGHSLSPGWVPLEACWTRALVFDGTTRVNSVEWTLFSGCSPQVWVDVGPLLGHHCHSHCQETQARVADMHNEPACVGGCDKMLLPGDSCRSALWWLTSKGKTPRLSSNRS